MATKKDPQAIAARAAHVTHCPVCGGVVPNTTGKRGRPRLYDTDECSEYARMYPLMLRAVDGVRKRLDATHKKRIRADLWHMANLVNSRK